MVGETWPCVFYVSSSLSYTCLGGLDQACRDQRLLFVCCSWVGSFFLFLAATLAPGSDLLQNVKSTLEDGKSAPPTAAEQRATPGMISHPSLLVPFAVSLTVHPCC